MTTCHMRIQPEVPATTTIYQAIVSATVQQHVGNPCAAMDVFYGVHWNPIRLPYMQTV